MMRVAASVLALCLLLTSTPVFADAVDQINALRSRGCDGKPGVSVPLRKNRDLGTAARKWAGGAEPAAAIDGVEYRRTLAASFRVSGVDDRKFADVIRRNHCNDIINVTYRDIGVYQRGNSVWMIMAAPAVFVKPKEAGEVRERVLALVNEARSKPRMCGDTTFEAAPPLTLSRKLNQAALMHSKDMARNEFFEHRGSDGSQVGDRVPRAGYRLVMASENIAAGAENADVVMRGWMDSPAHCRNIMNARITQMGLAYETNLKTRLGIYWTQVFATPR